MISRSKNKHYYDIGLLISCNIDEGLHTFNNIEIKFDDINTNIMSQIEIYREDDMNNFDIEGKIISAFRYDDFVKFIFHIKNEDNKTFNITKVGNIPYEHRLNEIVDISEDGVMDLLTSRPITFPIEIKAGEDIRIYATIPLSEEFDDTYVFVSPYFDISYDDTHDKVYMQIMSNYPLLNKKPEEVLEHISR